MEIKTRKNDRYGRPVESVTNIKQKHIKDVSKYYLFLNNIKNMPIRYDVIEVYEKNEKFFINHLKNLFW